MVILLAALLVTVPVEGRHPGHGSKVIMGTLKSVTSTAVTLEVRDPATASMRIIQILVDEDTKYRLGKEPVETPASQIGTRAVAVVDYEEGPNGEVVHRATEIRFTKPKNKP